MITIEYSPVRCCLTSGYLPAWVIGAPARSPKNDNRLGSHASLREA